MVNCRVQPLRSCLSLTLLITGTAVTSGIGVVSHRTVEAGAPAICDEPPCEAAFEALAMLVERATVRVLSGADRSSGVLTAEPRFVLTTAHGVHPGLGRVTVILPDHQEVPAEILLHDPSRDVALLKLPDSATTTLTSLPVESQPQAFTGAFVLACGFPGREAPGLSPVLRLGTIEGHDESSLRSSCTLTSGDSGGPLVSLDGRLIAIHHRIGTGPGQNLHRMLSSLMAGSRDLRRHLNAELRRPQDPAGEPGEGTSDAASRDTTRRVRSLLTLTRDQQAMVVRNALERTLDLEVTNGGAVSEATGTLLSPELAVTKLSELRHQTMARCRPRLETGSGNSRNNDASQESTARVIDVDLSLDLAVLRLETPYSAASDLLVDPAGELSVRRLQIVWNVGRPPAALQHPDGQLLDMCPVRPGIVCRLSHTEPALPPRLGMRLRQVTEPAERRSVEVEEVSANSAASTAGLRAGDVLLQLDDLRDLTLDGIAGLLETRQPGDWIGVQFRRGPELFTGSMQLQHDPATLFERTEYLDGRSGPVSMRRSGFAGVAQHDLPVPPPDCGGPVMDREGRVAGIHIARRARESSLMIPLHTVIRIVRKSVDAAGAGKPAQ